MSCEHKHPETGVRCDIEGSHREYHHHLDTSKLPPGHITWKVDEPPPVATRRDPTTAELNEIRRALQNSAGGGGRVTDPDTSTKAAKAFRRGSQRLLLLDQYLDGDGLTDEEAAKRCGLFETRSNWWHRCSDLRAGGLIEDTGDRRLLQSGVEGMVCSITPLGRAVSALSHDIQTKEG